MRSDVVIVGAGILGVSLAYHLANAGASVIVLEKEPAVAVHASGRNAGMFRQLYRNPQLSAWAKQSRETWPVAARNDHFTETGSYVVGRKPPPHSESLFEARTVTLGERKLESVYCATDGLLDSGNFVRSIAELLPPRRGSIAFEAKIRSITKTQGDWRIETEKNIISGGQLVITGGAWASSIVPRSGRDEEISIHGLLQPFARYLFVVDGWPTGFMPERDCGFYWNEVDEWYMRRWTEATRLVSFCDKIAARPDEFKPDDEPLNLMRRTLNTAFPDFADDLVIAKSWFCFRTYTEDQLPLWGPDPREDGLHWLSGFGGFGMSTGFAAAFDLGQLLLGRRVAVSPDVSISRFLSSK